MSSTMSQNKHLQKAFFILLTLLVAPAVSFGQSSEGGELFASNMEYILIGLLVLILTILLFGILTFGNRLVKVSVKDLALESGAAEEDLQGKFKLSPSLLPAGQRSTYKVHKLAQGFDITIKGKAPLQVNSAFSGKTYAMKPGDFMGLSPIPKLMIEEGQEVKAGDPVFYDKKRPDIIYTAPMSGQFVELRRGAQRRIDELVFLADAQIKYKDFGKADPNTLSREEVRARLLESGAWPLLRQRPFNVVPDADATPKMVYISCFNTAPLAIDYDFAIAGQGDAFQAGIDALNRMTDGGVHLGMNAQARHSAVFTHANNVTHHWFSGPHPAGNAGVQIHHVSPINKGETVWVLRPQEVAIIGRLFTEGHFNTQKLIAVVGSEVKKPTYVKTQIGVNVEPLLANNLESDHVRVISGDVLTGTKIAQNGFLGFYDEAITVIAEGDQYEAFGWLLPSYPRPSVSPTFLSHFFQGEELRVNTNQHGEERPFVVTGLYEELLPMDIYLMQLLKAIMVEDFEQMEGLGIYEVVEEDIAICEFACPSKTHMQEVLRKGLDLVRAEG